ncbi:MAG: hypothetical protein RL227_2026 [Pseudomonadota bacterium]
MTLETGQPQTIRAILGLRKLIIEGQLAPGERVLEQTLVDLLDVSRTPARAALLRVCEEGLLDQIPGGGYAVARFSEGDVFDAIAIRGTLEGMAARLAAERGPGEPVLKAMHRCVDELDGVVDNLVRNPDLTDYVRLNDRFHDLLLQGANSPMLRRALERQMALPFAAPNAFVSISRADTAEVQAILVVSQDQHRSLVEAIEHREGTRAEGIALEHARSAWKFLRRVFQADRAATLPPSMKFLEPHLR